MIIRTTIKDPYNWHPFFAMLPVTIGEEIQCVDGETTIYQQKAFLCLVERKLERNLSGTERWLYKLESTATN
jgi:hypothetical protein